MCRENLQRYLARAYEDPYQRRDVLKFNEILKNSPGEEALERTDSRNSFPQLKSEIRFASD